MIIRFLNYVSTFSHFVNGEINNRFEYQDGGDNVEVRTLGEGYL